MDKKIKHLEFIQTTINRMANDSFLIKGWCITITGALFAATIKENVSDYLYIAISVTIIFWFLNAYFLSQERLFRKLYDSVRIKKDEEIDFSMETYQFKFGCEWFHAVFADTLILFYVGILIVNFIVFKLL